MRLSLFSPPNKAQDLTNPGPTFIAVLAGYEDAVDSADYVLWGD